MKCQHESCKLKSLIQMTCTYCQKDYCSKHRLPFDHSCDIQKLQEKHKNKLIKQNPIVVKKKIEVI